MCIYKFKIEVFLVVEVQAMIFIVNNVLVMEMLKIQRWYDNIYAEQDILYNVTNPLRSNIGTF